MAQLHVLASAAILVVYIAVVYLKAPEGDKLVGIVTAAAVVVTGGWGTYYLVKTYSTC